MAGLADQIKQALAALATADAGERVGRRAQYEALNPPTEPNMTPTAGTGSHPARKQIALGVGDSLPAAVMGYAIGACHRMQADLLFLSTDAMQVRELLVPYLPQLKGIGCLTEELADGSAAALLQALKRHRSVIFAVSGAEGDPLRPLLRSKGRWRSPVPIVVVGKKAPDSPRKAKVRSVAG